MSKVRRLLLATAWITVGLIGIPLSVSAQKPSTNAHTLQGWVEILGNWRLRGTAQHTNAQVAIRYLGTNALPSLLTWIAYEPERPGGWTPNLPHYGDPKQYALAAASEEAFLVLGPIAVPALAALSNLVATSQGASRAIRAMGYIGPAALPTLLAILTNSPPNIAWSVPFAIAGLGTNAQPAVPALLLCLTNDLIRESAYKALVSLALFSEVERHLVIAEMTESVRHPDPYTRRLAIQSLGLFGKDAGDALPLIRAALNDPDEYVRTSAADALERITSDVRADAPSR